MFFITAEPTPPANIAKDRLIQKTMAELEDAANNISKIEAIQKQAGGSQPDVSSANGPQENLTLENAPQESTEQNDAQKINQPDASLKNAPQEVGQLTVLNMQQEVNQPEEQEVNQTVEQGIQTSPSRATDFIDCADNLPYDKWSQLFAHNAYSVSGLRNRDLGTGWTYYQQEKNALELMRKYGVRGLELDIHWYISADGSKASLCLCHESDPKKSCQLSTTVLRLGSPNELGEYLKKTVGKYLEENPNAVITLYLEDYSSGYYYSEALKYKLNESKTAKISRGFGAVKNFVTRSKGRASIADDPATANRNTWTKVLADAGLSDKIFSPDDLKQRNGKWPTLGELRNSGKRVILFSDAKDGCPYAFVGTDYVDQNGYVLEDEIKQGCKRKGWGTPENAGSAPFFRFNNAREFAYGAAGLNVIFSKTGKDHDINFLIDHYNSCLQGMGILNNRAVWLMTNFSNRGNVSNFVQNRNAEELNLLAQR